MIDPDSSSSIIVLILLLFFHAIFVIGRESISSIRRSRLLQLVEEENPAAKLIEQLTKEATPLLITTQLTLKILEFLMIGLTVWAFAPSLTQTFSITNNLITVLIIVGVTALLVSIIGDLIPQEVGRHYAEFFALRLVYPIKILHHIFAPLGRVIAKFGQIISGQNPDKNGDYATDIMTEDDLRTLMDASDEGGALGEGEKEMIYSIFNLDETFAREIMVPRIDMVAVEANATVIEALDLILEGGHSRLPVYVDSVDNVIGILYAKDLLAHWRSGGQSRSVSGLEREAYFVPETKPVSELLRELQARKVQIAVVVDEYGGVAGLVTIEDIVEEIVGEIQDEYDPEEFFMERISDDEYIFSARMDLDDINDIMSIDLPTDEIDTLGGLIYTTFGGVPEVGDTVKIDELRLTVLGVDGRRIKRVKILRNKEWVDNPDGNSKVNDTNPSDLVHKSHNAMPSSS